MVSKKLIMAAFVACAAAVLVFTACSVGGSSSDSTAGDASNAADSGSSEGAYRKIDAEEGKRMIDAGGVTVVDVRTPAEYAEKHIPGAVNIPNEDIGSQQPAELDDPEETLIVYCRTGVRSKQAADKLVEMGYRNVYDMGGIVDWPYDTVSGDAAL
ncbi:rhodanese-like domain-containing protein [Raoultibacter phocaeensis]|uniref:rhodanese-like domain-containing protein n=1 Tax=Raoultibacter phocaeensis TaxID=2479841 RepID=UPI001117FE08|nr:rhodanese-like domain-containing protein [Raoultibacter phocaeensis]